MEELINRLSTEFDDSEGWIRIAAASWVDDSLRLSLSVQFHDDAEIETWEISCLGVVEEVLSSEIVEKLSLSASSPLLKVYTEPEVQLMFSENACEPAYLLGVVCTSCMEVLGRVDYVSRFMNQAATVSGIVSSRFGLLGEFPASVASRIVEALADSSIRINALSGHMPKRWNGTEFVSFPVLAALEIGNCYVIAEKFIAVRAKGDR